MLGVYKAPVYDWKLLITKAGATLIIGTIVLSASGWLLIRQTAASRSLHGRAFVLGLMTNLLASLITVLVLETTVRITSIRTHEGVFVGSVALQPTWRELKAQSREVIAGIDPWGSRASYFVYDQELGWTVGSNRQSADGLYFSSVEGIRSAGPNMRMSERTAAFRIALVGDSNAFSFEVPFEDSWGDHLQRLLGDEVQVLNFGVDGYGVDQIYLRYQRDVRPWKPQVVLIGFSAHDLWRTMAVYPIVSFRWPGYLVKPRFAIENGELKLLNVPLPVPDEILNTRRIQQLPFVEYDIGYGTTDWRWRFEHAPLTLRFLTSAFPRWRLPDPRVSDEATEALNSRLLAQLVEAVQQIGAVPFVVLMSSGTTLALQTFARTHVPFLDANGCLTGIPADRRRVPSGRHYTGLANEAIARCMAPAVDLALRNAEDPARRNVTSLPR